MRKRASGGWGLRPQTPAYLIGLLLISSCNSLDQSLCKADGFFCDQHWRSEARNAGAPELYRAVRVYYDRTNSFDATLETEFGRRGSEGFDALLLPASHGSFDLHVFMTLLESLRSNSGIDYCSEPQKSKIDRYLASFYNRRAGRFDGDFDSHFEKVCTEIGDTGGIQNRN